MLASLLDRFDPQMDGMRKDWSSIFAQSERVLYEVVRVQQQQLLLLLHQLGGLLCNIISHSLNSSLELACPFHFVGN